MSQWNEPTSEVILLHGLFYSKYRKTVSTYPSSLLYKVPVTLYSDRFPCSLSLVSMRILFLIIIDVLYVLTYSSSCSLTLFITAVIMHMISRRSLGISEIFSKNLCTKCITSSCLNVRTCVPDSVCVRSCWIDFDDLTSIRESEIDPRPCSSSTSLYFLCDCRLKWIEGNTMKQLLHAHLLI